MSRIYLIRHAEPDESMRGRAYGRLDVPLSASGRKQASAIAGALREAFLEAVYTSPQRRAAETAAPLAADHGLQPIACAALRELDFGEIEGLTYAEIEAARPELFEAWMANPVRVQFPAGESFAALRDRATAAVERIRREHDAAAIVAHGGVTRAILGHVLGMPDDRIFRLDQPYGAVSIVDWQDGVPLVRVLNSGALPRQPAAGGRA